MTSEFAIAVHALVYLHHMACCLSSEKIAKNVCTNPARLRKVMAKLGSVGLVRTKTGADGGFSFNADPHEVTLSDVCRAVNVLPVYVSKKTGDLDMDCQIASGMAGIMDKIYDQLCLCCYEKLDTITIADVETMIFQRGNGKDLEDGVHN